MNGAKLVRTEQSGKLQYRETENRKGSVNALNKLRVPKGGEYSLFLADGSEVWINSESELQFPVRFSGNKREVWLEGEAFFKVAEHPDCPFIVHVNGFDITVLGTTFNVCAYAEEAIWHTTLVKGKVQIADTTGHFILKPSDQYTLDHTTGRRDLKKVDTELYTAWVEGKFYFDAFSFEEIVRKLERWYDFTIIYTDESIRKKRFSGAVNKDRPLEEILHHLERVSRLHFKVLSKLKEVGNKNVLYHLRHSLKTA